MILILPNISSILVDVWVIGYLGNKFGLMKVVIGFWIIGSLIFRRWILICWLIDLSSLDSDLLVN